MVTYNNIVDYFKLFAQNHFFIQSFSHGNIEEADLQKYGNYPIMHVNYTGSTYDEVENYSFEVYVLGLPPDKLDKISFQTEVISDSKQCLEDLISDIKLGENIFTESDNFDLVSASMTPLEEETKNVLSGMVLDLTFQVPFTYDTCDAPLTGVTPTPSGDCLPVRVVNSTLSYDVEVGAGSTLTLSDNQVTDIDGTTRDVAAQTDVVCEWTTIRVRNSDNSFIKEILDYAAVVDLPDIDVTQVNGDVASVPSVIDVVCTWSTIFVVNSLDSILATAASYPSGNRIAVSDIAVNEINGTETTQPSGVDVTCQWFDITLKDSEGTTLDVIESYPSGGEFVVPVSSATAYPNIIAHRVPSYTTGDAGDYPTLFAAGYFDIYFPTIAIEMVQLGADNFTLASNNRFGNTSRYTSTDGTPSDTGTARFSSYGTGVANVVIDHYRGVMWYNLPLGSSSTTWNNAQGEIDTINASSLAGFTDWIRPTRDILTISAVPDNNADVHTSPNLIEDTGTRRYMTCEALPNSGSGYIIFFTGGETPQTTTTTASGQNRVVACRLMTLAELFG